MSKYEDYKSGSKPAEHIAGTVLVDSLITAGVFEFTAGADIKQTGTVTVHVVVTAGILSQTLFNSSGHMWSRVMNTGTSVWTPWRTLTPISLPSVTVEGNPGSVPQGPVLTGSAFTSTDSADTHTSTDWVLVDNTGTAVWSSVQDTVNLTTVTLPSGTLSASTTYLLSVTYNSGTGLSSLQSMINFSTGLFPHVFTGTLTAKASSPARTGYNASAVLNDGRVLVAGGYNGAWVATAYIYDPATDVWTQIANAPITVIRINMSTLQDGTVLLTGGLDSASVVYSTTYLYDVALNTWVQKASLITGRLNHGQSTLPDGTVLVTGGEGVWGGPSLTTAEIYDPVTDVWTAKPAVASPALAFHVQATLTDGTVFVSGSNAGTDTTAYTYDPVTNVYTLLPGATAGYKYGDGVQLPSGQIFITERGKLYNYDLVTGQTLLPVAYITGIPFAAGTAIELLPDGTISIHDYGRMYIYS